MDKSKLMMVIIIVLLVLLLGTVGGVTWYLVNLVNDGIEGSASAQPQDDDREERHGSTFSLMDIDEVPVDQMMVNLAIGPRGTSDFVMVETVIGVDNRGNAGELATFKENLNSRLRLVSGIINTVFGELTYEEIRTPEGQSATAEEITRRLQTAFESPLILQVTFSEFFAQRGR